jgi:hypothetical protein
VKNFLRAFGAVVVVCTAAGWVIAGHDRTDTDRDSTRDTFPGRVIPPGFVNHPTWCGNNCNGEWDALIAHTYGYTPGQIAARYPHLVPRLARPPAPLPVRVAVKPVVHQPRPIVPARAPVRPIPAPPERPIIARAPGGFDPQIIAGLKQLFVP